MTKAFPFNGQWMRCHRAPHHDLKGYEGSVWWIGFPDDQPHMALAFPDFEYSETRFRIKRRWLPCFFALEGPHP